MDIEVEVAFHWFSSIYQEERWLDLSGVNITGGNRKEELFSVNGKRF